MSGSSGGAGSASVTPVVEQVIVVYEPRVAASTCPFPNVAETTGGDICSCGPGHLGVGGANGVRVGTEATARLGDAVAAGIGVGLEAPIPQAADPTATSVTNAIANQCGHMSLLRLPACVASVLTETDLLDIRADRRAGPV